MAQKKSNKQKKPPQFKGHYCKVCGERKANEKFSGRGHATHICKVCASKSPAQKSEDMTVNRLHGMAFRYLNEADIKWLKNRRNDSRPEVQELARQVFELKFPRQTRNEIKQRLNIKDIIFRIRGEIFDGYGDGCYMNAEYAADTSGKIVRKLFDGSDVFVEEKSVDIDVKSAKKFFNVMVHNYEISFWDEDLCHQLSHDPDIDLLPDYLNTDDGGFSGLEGDEDDDGDAPDDRTPTWSVEIKYTNGTEQTTKGYDFIPDTVTELFIHFQDYFEDEFDEDDADDGLDDAE